MCIFGEKNIYKFIECNLKFVPFAPVPLFFLFLFIPPGNVNEKGNRGVMAIAITPLSLNFSPVP